MEKCDEILNEALDAIKEDDFSKAKSLLENIIAQDENNIEAYRNLGLCEVNLDNPIEALKMFQKALEIDKDDVLSLYCLAACKAKVGQKEEAVKDFEEVIKSRPDYLEAYKNLAMIYVEFSQVESAIELLNSALNNSSIEPDHSLYYILATSYMLKKDYENAVCSLEKALELNNNHIPMMNSLSVCYMNIQEFEKSEEVLKKALSLDENNSLTNYNLAILFQTMGKYQEALKFFQISYQLEPSITMLASLANCALNAREYAIATSMYQNLVTTYPNNTQYRISYAEALEMTQQYAPALENVNLLLEIDPKNISLIKKKGALLRKLNLNEESVETFNILLKRGKIDVEVYYNLAFNYVELNDFDNAKEMFKKCITLEPNNPYAHKDLGVLYLKMNCYEWAVDEMKEAIALEDDVAEFYYSLGVAYMMLSKIDEAKEALLKALSFEPNDADVLAYLGYIYLLEKDYEKALSSLQKAIEIAPDNFLAKNYLAKYYFQQKKFDTAKQLLLDAINIIKDDETLNILGICYMETGEFEEASGILYKLSKDYPQNHILLTNLAKCEYKTGKKQEALEHLRQALMVFDDYEDALKLLEEINNG